jgi:two-component system chemotaxis response regulator CheB
MTRIRVLVVDDSVVVRRLVSDALGADPRIEVVGVAANGKVALAKIDQVNPDVVTLDIEMPVMDGLETLRHLRRLHPRLPVVMFSTLTERGASATLDALELGANDYVTKPANVGSVTASMDAVRQQLVPRLVALCGRGPAGVPVPAPAVARGADAEAGPPGPRPRVDVVAIGASTGGPDALTTVLAGLPANLPVPVVVVQHMPPVFTKQFADRLERKLALDVAEAEAGMAVRPGQVLIAPGDHHLRFRRPSSRPDLVFTALDQGTPENYCRPAVDVMFRSAVETWGAHVLAVVLTGMGSDGARGAVEVAGAGGVVLVQDEATSVVWGMPGSVVAAGVQPLVLPLDQVAPAIRDRLRPTRDPVPARLLERSS